MREDAEMMRASATIVTTSDVAKLQWQPFASIDGVHIKVFWRDDTSMAGVLRVGAGHRLGEHTHRANQHHMWILEGGATIVDAPVTAGAYVHIPQGIAHDIDASRTDGCTVMFLYLRPPGASPEGH